MNLTVGDSWKAISWLKEWRQWLSLISLGSCPTSLTWFGWSPRNPLFPGVKLVKLFFALITDPTSPGPYPAQARHAITPRGSQDNSGGGTWYTCLPNIASGLLPLYGLLQAGHSTQLKPRGRSLSSLLELSFLGNISHLREGNRKHRLSDNLIWGLCLPARPHLSIPP